MGKIRYRLQRRLVFQGGEIDKLKLEFSRLKRFHYGHRLAKLHGQIEQLALIVGELETLNEVEPPPEAAAQPKAKPLRQSLPEHLPHETAVHDSDDHCPDCGESLRPMGDELLPCHLQDKL